MRKHEMTVEIAATPAEVWDALSTAHGLTTWFLPYASVTPGQGGSITGGWAPGMEFTSQIEIWEPEKHIRTSSDRPDGPPNVVDYFIEGKGGTTVMRLVHSGFGSDASFDGEFEATGGAWSLFLKMLKHSVETGVGACANVTVFRFLPIAPAEAWSRLYSDSEFREHGVLGGVVRHFVPNGNCAFGFPNRGNAVLAVFCENCGGQTSLTLTWLLYGRPSTEVDAMKERWNKIIDRLFAQPEAASA